MDKMHRVKELFRISAALAWDRHLTLRSFILALVLAAMAPVATAAGAEPWLRFSYPATPERDFAAPGDVKILLNARSGCGPISIYVTGPIDIGTVANGETLTNLPPGRYFIDASFEMCDRRWLESPVGAGRAFTVRGGSITASPQTCTIPWGAGSCGTTINWSSNAPNAQVWYSLPDGSNMTLLANGQNGAAMAGVDTSGRRFYLKSGDLTLATVDATAVPTHNGAPSAAVNGPAQGSVHQLGNAVTLSASASDPDDGVQRVEFLIDGVKVGEDTSAPYEYQWTGLEGWHAFTARAFDTRGAQATSSERWFVVNGRPTITLTSPANNAQTSIPASFLLKADAFDHDGVLRVEFYADNQMVSADSVAPYEHTWSGASVGPHTVHAIVFDSQGASVRSATTNVSVTLPASGPTGLTRRYVYDQFQQLCKIIEPETGSTVMAYDAAGNVAWSAGGLDLPDPNNCNTAAAEQSGRRVDRSYDNRNRLATLGFPDGRGNQTWTYTPDGLPYEIVTSNEGPGQANVINNYTYNKRRLINAEAQTQVGWYVHSTAYGYDANGYRNRYTTPDGLPVNYANNALGQPTAVSSSWGNHATGISYYPNGGMKRFVYGNGVVHSMAQNARQLPERVTDAGVFDHTYAYDANGNTSAIRDVNAVQGLYSGNRDMLYDRRDRLVQAHLHWLTVRGFGYDALDNIRYKSNYNGSTTATDYYWYDEKNLLTNLRNDLGATTAGLGYDPQGNLNNKNGQVYNFDFGNRLRSVAGKESYRYDGHGRRVSSSNLTDTTFSMSFYNADGQILLREEHHTGEAVNDSHPELNIPHIYLNGSLLATIEWDRVTNTGKLKYQHTDALGSPIAVTDATGAVLDRTQWEPYGGAINKPNYNGVGYTGHVMDGATGLAYMQQRYYDHGLGRFLSVDPVTAYEQGGKQFNRYNYAHNNPYLFVDPDGRQAEERADWTSMSAHPTLTSALADGASVVEQRAATKSQSVGDRAVEAVKAGVAAPLGIAEGGRSYFVGLFGYGKHALAKTGLLGGEAEQDASIAASNVVSVLNYVSQNPALVKDTTVNAFKNATPSQRVRLESRIIGRLGTGYIISRALGAPIGLSMAGNAAAGNALHTAEKYPSPQAVIQSVIFGQAHGD